MKRMYVTLGTLMMCSAALMAQSMDKDKAQMDSKMMKDGVVMVTGCVAQGGDMKHYKLTNAMMSQAPMGTTGSDAAMKSDKPSADMAMWYELDGGDLKPHVGHKVEVSGTMDKKPTMDHDKMEKSATTMGDKDKMDTMAHKDMMAGKIKVKSVKMLSATCM